MEKVHPDVDYVMISARKIQKRVKALAAQMDKLYEGRKPGVVCILKGSVLFYADLIRNMKTQVELDFMSVSSYGNGTKSTGELKIKKDLSCDIKDRDVLIVEDIIDSGNTLYNLKKMLIGRQPASINLIALLDKPDRREMPIEPDYKGFVIEDKFVIGYGLDYAEDYRNLPYIGVLKPCVYSE